jgi:hypothetical protein
MLRHDSLVPFSTLLALSLQAGLLHAQEAAPTAPEEPGSDLPALTEPQTTAPVDAATGPAAMLAGGGVSQNVTVNLINRLVKRGVLSQDDAKDLITMAQADAEAARLRDESMRVAIADAAAPPLEQGDVGVSYVPEPVRQQMQTEIKAQLMAEAREREYSAKNPEPEWKKQWKVFGDLRTRYEGTFFPDGNDNTGAFPNFNAINTGAPFDVSGTQFSPQLNVDQDRQRFRFRFRAGAAFDLEDGFTGGFRVATGDSNSPVSTNQSFGTTGGNFSKYQLWLDRAFLSYNFGKQFDSDLNIDIGRFENPFFSSEVMWDDDIGLDGIALRGSHEICDGVKVFGTGGAFPIFNTDFNFATNNPAKFDSTDKYLFAGQLGVNLKIKEDLTAKFAVAYYDFSGAEGEFSTPFTPLTASDAGDTDSTRPSFAQKGNTCMPLRTIIPDASNGFGTTNQWQYFGLATPFKNVTFTGRLDYDGYEPIRLSAVGEVIKNVAFDEERLSLCGVNNRGPAGTSGTSAFEGGDMAWFLNLIAGSPSFDKRGDWNTFLGYRYVESDAVIDGFTDSDFGGGGTNMKGFTIGGNYALTPSVRVGARWMSANEIAGPTLKSDVLQFDINAKF